MQREQTHPTQNALVYPIDDRIINLRVRRMSPPGEHIGRRSDVLGQTVLWLILSSRIDDHGAPEELRDAGRDCPMHAVWIALGHAGLVSFESFVKILAPYGDADR